MTQPLPDLPPVPQRSLAPRTPWPASGVALRLGLSLALLAVTLPLLVHRVLTSETVERLRAETSAAQAAAPVQARYRTTGAPTAPLHVSVQVEQNDVNLKAATLSAGTQASSAQATAVPGLQAVLRQASGQPRDRLRAVQPAAGELALTVLGGKVRFPDHPGTLDLQVHPATPLSLDLQGSASTRLDLSRTTLRALTLRQHLGSARISFPAHGEYRADLRADLGTVALTFPAGGYRAQLRVQTDLGAVTVTVPRGARVRLHTVSDLSAVVLPGGYTASGTAGSTSAAAPDLTLDLQTDVGRITVQEAPR